MLTFRRNEKVLELMDKLMLVLDGEPSQDCANALQYVLNIIHCGGSQLPPSGGSIPTIQHGPVDSGEEPQL